MLIRRDLLLPFVITLIVLAVITGEAFGGLQFIPLGADGGVFEVKHVIIGALSSTSVMGSGFECV